jgi:hypothetical protein
MEDGKDVCKEVEDVDEIRLFLGIENDTEA